MTDAREQQLLAEIGRLHMELLRLASSVAEPPAEPAPAVLPVPAGPRRPQRLDPNGS